MENTVSPGYYSEAEYTRVDKELKRLYERTGDSEVFPKSQQKSFTQNGKKYNLDAKEYTRAKKLRGKKSFELVKALMDSGEYKKMSDAEKVKAISKCYTEAGQYAKDNTLERVKKSK